MNELEPVSITLREINAENYYEVSRLTTNKSGEPTFDEEFLCGNVVSIAESKYYPALHPQAIYNNETLIGFIMSGPYANDHFNFWVLRFMIDYRFQGKGLGKAAFLTFIEQAKELGISQIFLGLYPENIFATKLYTSCGFHYTGVDKDGEKIYAIELV